MPRLRELLIISSACWALVLTSLPPVQGQEDSPFRSPTADSPLLVEPTTPEESFAAALLMVDLARMDLARLYLNQFDKSAPDDAVLMKLRDRHGTAAFLKLARIKELQPLSEDLLTRLNAASRQQSEDPAFVDTLIGRLVEGPTQRELAIVELRNAGPRAVPQIIRQMGRPEMRAHQDVLTIALIRMGRQVTPPLLGALDSPQERIRAAVIGVLEALDAKEAIPYLWFPAFSEDQPLGVRMAANRALAKLTTGSALRVERLSSVDASHELRIRARRLYEHPAELPADENGQVTLWSWDGTQETTLPQTYSPRIASLLMSSRFAAQALALSPEQPESQRQYLAAILGLEVLQKGWDQPRDPVPDSAMYVAMTAGEETVAAVLGDALAARQPATAVAALEVLSQIGSREQLSSQPGIKSPVLAALNSPDPRVQFAAAVTVLRMEPRVAFAHSTRVVSVLTRALTDPGRPMALVVDPDADRASQAAGYLNDLGYESATVATGREGFERAASTAGVEVVLIHANTARWGLTQTLSNLRADARTAAIPVVVYGAAELRGSVERLVTRSRPALFVPESSTASEFHRNLVPFLQTVKSDPMTDQERARQKVAAAYWLATLATTRSSVLFDISGAEKELSLVAEDPNVSANAIVALSGIPSGSAQRRLAALATNPQGEAGLRQMAANQLGFHIQRFGLLLTKDEVGDVHTSWTAAQDPAVKSSLAAVMGVLRPDSALVGERLRQFASPAGSR